MKFLDFYIRSIYFAEGEIGMVKLSVLDIGKGILNLPLLVIWSVWKGLFQ